MTRRLISALVATVAFVATPLIGGAQTIDTRPPSQEFFWSGFTSGVMLGQTFHAASPSSTFLEALNVYKVKVDAGQPATYTASVSVWNSGTQTRGAQIWTGSGSSLTTSYSDLAFAINTPLSFGTQYIFSLLINASGGHFFMGGTPYAGGGFYYQNGATPNATWNGGFSNYDLAFSASIVPEPSSIILLASGLAAVAGLARLRRTDS